MTNNLFQFENIFGILRGFSGRRRRHSPAQAAGRGEKCSGNLNIGLIQMFLKYLFYLKCLTIFEKPESEIEVAAPENGSFRRESQIATPERQVESRQRQREG